VRARGKKKTEHKKLVSMRRRLLDVLSRLAASAPLAQPDAKGFGADLAAGDGERDADELVVIGRENHAIDVQEELGRRRPRPLVPVHERVVHHQRVHEGGRLGLDVRVEVLASEGHLRPRESRLRRTAVTQAPRAARGPDQHLVQTQQLGQGQVLGHFASSRYARERRSRSSSASFSKRRVTLPSSK